MLLEALAGRGAHEPLLVHRAGTLTVGDWRAAAHAARAAWPQARGAAVALWLREPLAFAQALPALDGFAARLLLLPAETTPERAAALCERAGCTLAVVDHELPLPAGVAPLHRPPAAAARDTEADPAPALSSLWILSTSGTTGEAKLVPHAPAALAATVRTADRGRTLVWGLPYDPARMAGLQVLLQALLGGSAVALPAAGTDPSQRLAFFAAAGVNALSATPTLWRRWLMLPPAQRALPLQIATLGGETADQPVLDAIARAWPAAKRRHVYASTEAGVGFAVTDGLEGFPAAWLQQPPAGVELRVAPTEGGEAQLWLRSPRTAGGYLGGATLRDGDGWVASGDAVRLAGDRVLFLGRLGGAINVGGDKVWPERVERVLCEHPAVAAASVRARASALTGALVEAAVVPRTPGDAALRGALLAHCRERLERPAVPALIRFVDELAATAAGKQDRRTAA